jgi:aminoglycoside phosphotransferase (APT) family kinase protein
MSVALPTDVARAWRLAPEGAQRLGKGRINDTLLVPRAQGDPLVVQRLHPEVFPSPEKVMANLEKVLSHLPPGPLRLVPTAEGEPWMRDQEGHAWRAWVPIQGVRTVEGRATPAEALACSRAFGRFLADLMGIPPGDLHTIIEGFHHTPERLADFERADSQADASLDEDRANVARLSFLAPVLQGLPLRVAHDDTKLNNVLLHEDRDEAVAVLDLDTVQPGSWAVDFGDMARSACNPVGEEGGIHDVIPPDLETFAALAKGFQDALGPHLSQEERDRLPLAPAVLAFELGLRFLTDHLQGDRLFRAETPGQNLNRARTQFALAKGFLQAQSDLTRSVGGR